ncbi:MAG: NAD-dependent epimerase/dehydratase family protein [Alphaproteobacteria bacterium]|nr:NAD-dependent epimerase/dehydratase family protein [Alphaproteobacteria bacterium]
MGRKIVITGAAGFIGSQLAWELHSKGNEVVLIDDLSFGYESNLLVDNKPFGRFVKKDVREPDLHEEFKGADCVFHLAAISALPVNQSEPARAISINVAGTANVLEAARREGVRRVVFAGTSAIYENNAKFPCHEDDPVSPRLTYSLSKWQAEKLCESFSKIYGMEIAVTRYYNVYGPHQDIRRKSPPFVGYVVRELLNNRAPVLHSNGEQRRDYVFLRDVNRINIACMTEDSAKGEVFNVASGKAYSVNEMYDCIAKIVGTNIKPVFVPAARFWDQYPDLFQGNNPMDPHILEKEVEKFTLGATEKAERLLGWKAETPLEDGLRETVEYTRRLLANG